MDSKRLLWCIDPHHGDPCPWADQCVGCRNDCSGFAFYGTDAEAFVVLASARESDRSEESLSEKRLLWCVDPHHAYPCSVPCGGCRYDDCSGFVFEGTEAEASEALASARLPTFTVVGVYTSGDSDMIGERFADWVQASDWLAAVAEVKEKRASDSIMIAGVLEGEHSCVDEQ